MKIIKAPTLPPAAVTHGPGSHLIDDLLDRFAHELIGRGFRVGGLIQRNCNPLPACAEQMDLVDLLTGEQFVISQDLGPHSNACRVNPAGVVAAAPAISRAITAGVDLLVVNKFGGLEAENAGLSAEMLAAMAEGVPLLTSVGGRYLNEWQKFTGGQTSLLSPRMTDLWHWWGAHHLYQDLLLGVVDAEIQRITIGRHWVMVETATAVGLAALPDGISLPDNPVQAGTLSDLIDAGLNSWQPLEVALAIAAINAHYNQPALLGDSVNGPAANGLDLFAGTDGPLVVIGAFPDLAKRRPDAIVLDLNPTGKQLPAHAAGWVLPDAGGVVITASTLTNRSLPNLLGLASHGRNALVGPGTPLTPRLFSYGLQYLAGFVVVDRIATARVILEGGSSRDFKPYGRQITLGAR